MSRSERIPVTLVAHTVGIAGGQEKVLAQLVRLASDRISFRVVAVELDPALRPFVDEVTLIPVPEKPFVVKFFAFWFRSRRAIAAMEPAVVYSCGAITAHRSDVVAVHFCHAAHQRQTSAAAPSLGARLRWANRRLTAFASRWAERSVLASSKAIAVPVSPRVEEELKAAYPGVATQVIRNGVETDRFLASSDQRRLVREEFDLDDACRVVLFVGGDWERKGLGPLIDACSDASVDELWVAGRGLVADYQTQVDDAAVAVRWLGQVDEVERLYAAADVFALPSYYEADSLVLYEAASASLPIVTTDVGGATDLLTDGESVCIVEPTAASIAAGLDAYFASETFRRSYGQAARTAVEKCSWAQMADATVAVIQSMSDHTGQVHA